MDGMLPSRVSYSTTGSAASFVLDDVPDRGPSPSESITAPTYGTSTPPGEDDVVEEGNAAIQSGVTSSAAPGFTQCTFAITAEQATRLDLFLEARGFGKDKMYPICRDHKTDLYYLTYPPSPLVGIITSVFRDEVSFKLGSACAKFEKGMGKSRNATGKKAKQGVKSKKVQPDTLYAAWMMDLVIPRSDHGLFEVNGQVEHPEFSWSGGVNFMASRPTVLLVRFSQREDEGRELARQYIWESDAGVKTVILCNLPWSAQGEPSDKTSVVYVYRKGDSRGEITVAVGDDEAVVLSFEDFMSDATETNKELQSPIKLSMADMVEKVALRMEQQAKGAKNSNAVADRGAKFNDGEIEAETVYYGHGSKRSKVK